MGTLTPHNERADAMSDTHKIATTIEPHRIIEVSTAEYENLRGLGILTEDSATNGGLTAAQAKAAAKVPTAERPSLTAEDVAPTAPEAKPEKTETPKAAS